MKDILLYKNNLINYLNTLNDNDFINIELEDFLCLMVTPFNKNDPKAMSLLKQSLPTFKNNLAKCKISSIKKMIEYFSTSGLDEHINNQIVNLLLINNIIKSENNTDIKRLAILKEQYDKEKFKLLNNILYY